MQFFAPEYFLALWIVPVLLAIFWASDKIRERRLSAIGLLSTLQSKLMPSYRPGERKVRAVLLLLVFIFSILALARPQWGEEKKKIQRKGVDVLFLLDTSLSMMAEDAKPSRLEKARLEVKSLIKQIKGDRVGMITFAGSSFLQSPLTLDYSAFLLFLDSVKTGFIPDPGTSLAQALELAIKAFPEKGNKYEAVILLTDGEDNEGGLEAVLPEVAKAGIRVYSICFGSAEGEPIPLKDEQGRKTGVKKDHDGQVVISKANMPLLEKIAAATGGIALPSTPGEQEAEVILKHMASLGKRQFQEKEVREREDHFQLFLFLAFLCLMAEMFYRSTVKIPLKALSILLVFFMTTGFLDRAQSLNEEGNKLFEEKKYQSALQTYQKAKAKAPDNPAIRYNTGTTLYQLEQYQEAGRELEKALSTAKDNVTKEKTLYNYGNTQYRLGKFEKAMDAYQKALEINPDDKDAKYNLEFLQHQKSMFEKKNNKQDKKDKQKQNQQQQQNQQKNQQQDQNQQRQNQNQQQNQQQKQDPQNQQQNQEQNQSQQNQQNQQQDQKDQEQQKKDQEQQNQQNPQKKDQGQQQPEQGRQDQDQQSPSEQQKKEQEQQREQEKQEQQAAQQGQERPEQQEPPQKGEPQRQGPGQRPLQGQMSMDNALQILDAMKESEKELQDLRRPPAHREQAQVGKDW